jgi:hypothetical protein
MGVAKKRRTPLTFVRPWGLLARRWEPPHNPPVRNRSGFSFGF